MRINNNLMAMNAQRYLGVNNANTQKSIEKLSSGNRINRAGDDAAGLAISEKMRAQIRGLDMAAKNSQDAISLIQTAEGALNETHSILQRMRELAVQASTDTNDKDIDRASITSEISQLKEEITRIADQTQFNGKTLLNGDLKNGFSGTITNVTNLSSVTSDGIGNYADAATIDITSKITHAAESTGGANDGAFQNITFAVGTGSVSFNKADIDAGTLSKSVTVNGATFTLTLADAATLSTSTGNGAAATSSADTFTAANNSLTFQIGANSTQSMSLSVNDMSSIGLGVDGVDVTDFTNANNAITTIDNAIKSVSTERSKLGANQNRLEHTINNLSTSSENLTAAESRIRDVDMADEMMTYTKNNILTQAATAMLAQANQAPQSVLQLLQ